MAGEAAAVVRDTGVLVTAIFDAEQKAPKICLVVVDPLLAGEAAAVAAVSRARAAGDTGVLVVAILAAEKTGGLYADGFLEIIAALAIQRA